MPSDLLHRLGEVLALGDDLAHALVGHTEDRDDVDGADGRLPAPLDRPGGCRVGRSRKRPVRCAMCGTGRRRCTGFDVRSSTVRIFRTDEGRRFLTITLRAHSRPFDAWMSGVALDTRGDGRVDRIAFLNYPLGAVMPQGERCGIKRAEPDSEPREGVYLTRRHGEVATCRFPLEWLVPTKRPISWHVTTNWMFPEPASMIDRAPGRGWYP